MVPSPHIDSDQTIGQFDVLMAEAVADRQRPGAVDADDAALWHAVAGRLEPVTCEAPRSVPLFRRSVERRKPLGYAAGLIAALAVGAVLPNMYQWLQPEPPVVREYHTQRAQRAELSLPDGSHVVLGPASTLRYTSEGKRRHVELDGQASFTVTQGATHPFTVHAAGIETRVLGTTFTVRSYQDDPDVRLAVAEGRVAVTGGREEVTLAAGDMARVAAGSMPEVSHDVTLASAFGWTRGQLSFVDTPLGEIIADLERTYNVNITLSDPQLAERRITVTLVDNSADVMLGTIVPALDAQYRRWGQHITLYSNPRP